MENHPPSVGQPQICSAARDEDLGRRGDAPSNKKLGLIRLLYPQMSQISADIRLFMELFASELKKQRVDFSLFLAEPDRVSRLGKGIRLRLAGKRVG